MREVFSIIIEVFLRVCISFMYAYFQPYLLSTSQIITIASVHLAMGPFITEIVLINFKIYCYFEKEIYILIIIYLKKAKSLFSVSL
jgi:hypothetical protein